MLWESRGRKRKAFGPLFTLWEIALRNKYETYNDIYRDKLKNMIHTLTSVVNMCMICINNVV